MIAAWMLYAVVVATLAAGAALLAERALRWAGLGGRWAWVAAVSFSMALPAAALLRETPRAARVELIATPRAFVPAAAPAVAPLDAAVARARALIGAAAAMAPALPSGAARWNGVLIALWGAGAALALLRLALLATRLHRVRRRWPRATVQGEPVLVAEDVGPAVAGLDRGAIVLPRWAIDADPDLVRLMVAHEREHVRGRDPWLLLGGALAVALVPWNVVLHWQLRRLRLAVELDCDARVLRHHPDVRRYGALLLAVGARAPRLTTLPLAAMADRPTTLERRIRAMTTPRPRFRTALTIGSAVPALLLVAVACETPRPSPLEPENRVSAAALASGPGTDSTMFIRSGTTNDDLRVLVAAAAARGAAGDPIFIFLDTASRVLSVQAKSEAGSLNDIDAANIATIEVLKGAAAARIYGEGAAGGVISVVLEDGRVPQVNVRSAASAQEQMRGRTPERRVVLRTPIVADSAGGAVQIRRSRASSGAQGDAPWVTHRDSAGRVTSESTARDPLYVVDGVILGVGTDISRIPRESIASVEVLKGETARARYGDRAANGVVLIRTKGKL